MAFINDSYCPRCKKMTSHLNGECSICSDKEERKRIAKWNALTTNKKLSNLRKRVESLERGPIRF
jgi:hypothetical protein